MSDGIVKRWWLYERVGLDGKPYSGDAVPHESRRIRLDENGQTYFKPIFGDVYLGPAVETEVMPTADHDAIVAKLTKERDELKAEVQRFHDVDHEDYLTPLERELQVELKKSHKQNARLREVLELAAGNVTWWQDATGGGQVLATYGYHIEKCQAVLALYAQTKQENGLITKEQAMEILNYDSPDISPAGKLDMVMELLSPTGDEEE